jgi:DNA-binding CsgD family transcriptional regulator
VSRGDSVETAALDGVELDGGLEFMTELKAPEDVVLDPHASESDAGSPTCDSAPRRATKVDIERRLARISELLGRGLSGEAIVRRIATEDGIGERQARTHVTAVRKEWTAAFAAEEPHRRAQLLAYLDAVAAAAFEDRAWGACVAAARELARVLGLDRMTVKVEGPVDVLAMSPVEREAEIAKLLKRREAALGRHGPPGDARSVGRSEP